MVLVANLTDDAAGLLGSADTASLPVLPVAITWAVVIAGLVVVFVLPVRSLDLRRRRRRAEQRLDRREAQLLADAERSVCATTVAHDGRFAAAYAQQHLLPDRTFAAALTDAGIGTAAQVRRCPTTLVPWLCGPIGHDGHDLALRGADVSRAR
ncbi:hypothetical protein [Cellulomonas sp. KRMCY2]|uniref:hypothetical protein n=1 Tax=Cellulomonas sp. KRMCY2 TaxID=1304865 RepID=UPI00045E9C59|nr:hypothetical protein [Cellulomonas sp. KRMCY2]